MFFPVGETDEEEGQCARREQHDESPVPAQVLYDRTHGDVGEDGRAEEVSEESGQSGGCPGGLLGCEVEGLYADQHHGAVDQESDGDQRYVIQQYVVHVFPVDHDEDRDECHVDHGRDGPASFEDLVRQPSADDRAGDGCPFVCRVGPAHILDVITLDVLQVGRRPVQYAVTHQVHERIGEGDIPEYLVVEYVFALTREFQKTIEGSR